MVSEPPAESVMMVSNFIRSFQLFAGILLIPRAKKLFSMKYVCILASFGDLLILFYSLLGSKHG